MAINNGYEMDDKCCPNCGEAPILDGGACPELDAAYQTLLNEFGTLMIIHKDHYMIMAHPEKKMPSAYMPYVREDYTLTKKPNDFPLSYQIGNCFVTVQTLPQEKYDGVPADTHSI